MTTRTAFVIVMLMLGTLAWSDQPIPVQNAVKLAAQSLQVAPEQVTLISAEAVKWPDSSLGVRRAGQMYLQVITPGYKVIVQSGGRRLEYHTDMGDNVVMASNTVAPAPNDPAPVAAPAIADDCCKDLADRLHLPVARIKTTSATPQLFPDASLGLCKPDEVVAQVQTPGFVIILSTGQARYLYTASEQAFRYGGPLDSWAFSALHLQPQMDEPNLNGNLLQVSLAGTNPTVLLTGVSRFWAQADGSVLASRRTSRSGFDLLYVAPGTHGEAIKLASAFDFGQSTVSPDGAQWAALIRCALGGPWQLALGKLGAEGFETLPLPVDLKPEALWWSLDNPVLRAAQDGQPVCYELKLDDNAHPWLKTRNVFPPESDQFMLNKSETLVVKTEAVDGRPVTRVSKEWFTGDDKPVATIEGFSPTSTLVSRYHRFLLMSGQRDGVNIALTVDLATGEVLQTVPELQGQAQLLLGTPAQSWLAGVVAKLRSEQ